MESQRYDGLVADVTARHGDVSPGQMFGMPCLKRGGKVVAGEWKDGGLTVKLTDEATREDALAIDGASLFDPGMGRPMREWVHVPAAQSGRSRAVAARPHLRRQRRRSVTPASEGAAATPDATRASSGRPGSTVVVAFTTPGGLSGRSGPR